MTTPVQQYLGRFTLLRLRGSSSYASLYQAVDGRDGRTIALKLFSHNLLPDCYEKAGLPTLNERLAALRHPHHLPALEWGRDSDSAWVASEFMPGGSLKERLAKRLGATEVASILEQVAAGLDAAHAAGILHLDMKPANVLRDESGNYRLADFGMAQLAEQAPAIVRLYAATPLPTYMSPEQASEMSTTPRSDVYSLGVLAYHLLTGEVPYPGQDAITVAGKQAKGPPEDPREYERSIPPAVAQAIMAALAGSPERRPASAGEFARAFKAAAEQPVPILAPVISTNGVHAAPYEEPQLCWHCGHMNPPLVRRCEDCWMLLASAKPGEGESIEPMTAKPRVGEKTRNGLLLAVAMATAMVVGTVIPDKAAPKTSTSVSAVSNTREWTSHQADARNSGFIPGPAPALAGDVRWRILVPAPIFAPPVVTEDAVYFGTGDARVMAVRPSDGSTIWERKVNGPMNAAPAIAGNLVYFGQRDGTLLALDKRSGSERWSLKTGGSIYGGMKVHNGFLYLGNGNGAVLAIDAATGAELWRYQTGGWITAVPALTDDGLLVIGSEDGSVYVLDAKTGTLALQNRVIFGIDTAASVAGDVAYLGRDQGAMLAVDLKARTQSWDDFVYWSKLQMFVFGLTDAVPVRRGLLWRIAPGGGQSSSPAIAGDTAYMVTQAIRGSKVPGGALHAIDLVNKKRLWSHPVMGSITPIVIGNTVYVSSTSGEVRGVDASTGDLKWKWSSPGGLMPSVSPVVAGGTLYVGASLNTAPVFLVRRDKAGAVLADQNITTPDNWYYHYGETLCRPDASKPVGPFAGEREALSAGYRDPPSCGALFAVG